jgi:hypothetical protein
MNQPEWDRINWAAPYSIFVLDDFVNQRVMVAAPLDTATEPSHILVWDYSRGLTPYTVDFSLDNFDFGEFSSLALIQDKDTNRSGVDTGTNVIRAVWESGFALGKAARRAHSNRFGGADIDAAGEGFLKSTVYEKGRADFVRPDRFELENPPEDEPQLLFDLATEDVSYRIEVDQPGHWFDLRGIGVYHRPWISE